MIRRGIIVVHAVGDQRRGEQLDVVADTVEEFIGRALGHPG